MSSTVPFPGDDDPKVQAWRLRKVEKIVETIAADIDQIKISAAKLPPPCPRPGLCIEHEKEIGKLKAVVDQGKGAVRMAAILGAIVGSLGSFVGIKLIFR